MAMTDLGLLGAEVFDVNPGNPDAVLEDEESVQGYVTRAMQEALRHYEDFIEPRQLQATDYYHGRPFGNEEEDRSQIVVTSIRDAIQSVMPSLMRLFFGPNNVVEYRARHPSKEEQGRQATDYINYIVREDNEGFAEFHAWFKDALSRNTGVMKWWPEFVSRTETIEYTGLSDLDAALLEEQPDVYVLAVHNERVDESGETIFDATVRRTYEEFVPRFEAVPSEEVLWSPDARSFEDSILVAHFREMPAGDIIALGIDPELVAKHRGQTRDSAASTSLKNARHIAGVSTQRVSAQERDASTQETMFAEVYLRIDLDGDGIPELRRFDCVGLDFEIANGEGELVDEVPMALITPDPEPHTVAGLSFYDRLRDVQEISSLVTRGMINSLALALDPATEVVDGEVNVDDLLRPSLSRIVRVRRPGMMREVKHEFVGGEALAVLEHMQGVQENRTLMSKAAAGLDADALQSSTKMAVAATLSAAQQHTELIARIFAETGVRKLFRGLLRMIVQHQNRPRVIRLRGKYVEMDPRAWDAMMDVEVNVALGMGMPEDKIASLVRMAEEQSRLLEMKSPLVSNVEYRATLAQLAEMAGWKNADAFFKPWGPQEEAQYQQMLAQQPPQPDPQMILAQTEAQKALQDGELQQKKLDLEMRKLELEARRIELQADIERDKLAREFALKESEQSLKYEIERGKAIREAAKSDREQQELDLKHRTAAVDSTLNAASALTTLRSAAQAEGAQDGSEG